MDQRTYLRETVRAVRMARAEPGYAEYWEGYRCGLRRAQFGTECGTEDQHHQWMAMAESADTIKAAFGRGYRDGLIA